MFLSIDNRTVPGGVGCPYDVVSAASAAVHVGAPKEVTREEDAKLQVVDALRMYNLVYV
jgi:hypothetical protein